MVMKGEISMTSINGIHHICLLAQNVERTARFYIDVLGLHLVDTPDQASSASGQLWLGDSSAQLFTIIQSTDGQAGEIGIGTVHHVALVAETDDVLLKWKRWLEHNQVLVLGPYDQQAYQDIIFVDPDGVLIEIATRGPGWQATQDGRDVYVPPIESMAPHRDEEVIRMRTWPHPVTQIEPDMVLQGLHHISTIASSLDETDHFYRATLGLELVRKALDHDDPEVEHWYWGLEGRQPETVITAFPMVHEHEGGKPIYGRAGIGVVHHIALETDFEGQALEQWCTELSNRGLQVTTVSAHQPQSLSLQSPDGLVVEVVAADRGNVTAGKTEIERSQGTAGETST